MGIKKYRKQCVNCAHLPREPKDEDWKNWIEPDNSLPECNKFKQMQAAIDAED